MTQHGKDCSKIKHVTGGYEHHESDDSPYDVDGVTYCGRCHAWMGIEVAAPEAPSAPAKPWTSPTWTLDKARAHGRWIATQRAHWQDKCNSPVCDLRLTATLSPHRVIQHIDSVDEHVEGLLALVTRMRPFMQHSRTYPACEALDVHYPEIPGSGGKTETKYRDCTCGLAALFREIDGGDPR